jgi:hypothetical protein
MRLVVTPMGWLEVAAAVALFVLGVWLYRRRRPSGYGSQGAVILFVVAAIIAVHGLGLLDYRPSAAELEALSQ